MTAYQSELVELGVMTGFVIVLIVAALVVAAMF